MSATRLATPLDLACAVRAKVFSNWETGLLRGIFHDVSDVCERIHGPPLVTDPPEESKAKMHAVNVLRRAIADEIGLKDTPEIADWERRDERKHEDVIVILDRAIARLEAGYYFWNKECRLVYRIGRETCNLSP